MKKSYFFLACVICTLNLFAQWSGDPVNGGTPVCIASTGEQSKISVSDGSNGAIIVFESYDNNTGANDFYVQRINSAGQVQWGNASTPKPVCITATEKYLSSAIPDGSGGIYISWVDYRNAPDGEIYMQHINSTGNPVWALNGVKVNNSSNPLREMYSSKLCSDGGTGVVICWTESEYNTVTSLTTYSQVFVQKYNSAGTALWSAGGVQICTATGIRAAEDLIPDGSNGAIICFGDTRNSNQSANDEFDNIDIYAQRISSTGALQWTTNGVAVNTQQFNQYPSNLFGQSFSSVSDGAGGVILIFDDYTGDNNGPNNFFAQKLNASGARQWAAAGVPVCTADSVKFLIKTVSDGAGGMVLFFNDNRDGLPNSSASYAQRVLNNGTVGWTTNGVKIIDDAGYFGSYGNDMTEDGSGNYIFNWTDPSFILKAQKINNNGALQWGTTGKDICTNPDAFPFSGQAIKSNAGAAIINWVDGRNATTATDIYAAKISSSGVLEGAAASTSYTTIANGNWNAPATWEGGIVPPAAADVTIRHTVIVTTNASCKSLKVEKPAGSITVNTGVNLSVQQ